MHVASSIERFMDRNHAGRLLAARLRAAVSGASVVAGIPRGGIVVAAPIAEALRAPLVPVFARKLGAPSAPELAFGAIDDDGEVVLDHITVAELGLEEDDIERVRRGVWDEIDRRRTLYGAPLIHTLIPGRAVVLVDDGLATGLTMCAAAAYVRRQGPRELIIATPCASVEAADRCAAEADRFVALSITPGFLAVGAYYDDFGPIQDGEVVSTLKRVREANEEPAGDASGSRSREGTSHATQ